MAQDDQNWDDAVWDEATGEFVFPDKEEDSTKDAFVMEVKDSLGKPLANGDSVVLTRDLDVKGSAINLKRGAKVKVKLSDDPELIECKIGKSTIFLKTCFLKKV